MNYTRLTLLAFGLLGILVHNLVELGKINKSTGGKASLRKYLNLEKYNILISIVVICICIMAKEEIKQLEAAGKWIGFGFAAIGYMGQSLVIFFIGKANSVIGKQGE